MNDKVRQLVSVGLLAVFLIGCSGAASSSTETVLVDRTVIVAGGGGGAEITFTATSGQKILITLTASNTNMEPYGHLEYPDGTAQYYPPLDTAKNGTNAIELALNLAGKYTLTVFDGTNRGGNVVVKITRAK
jgi:hypothetical protein